MTHIPLPADIHALAYRHARDLHDKAIGDKLIDGLARLLAHLRRKAAPASNPTEATCRS